MTIKKQLNEIAIAITDSQNVDNLQSAKNIEKFDKIFSARIDSLTDAINRSSRSSAFLSGVIILLTVIGTIIAGAALWLNYDKNNYLSTLTNEQFNCVSQNIEMTDMKNVELAIEYCLRDLK